MPRCSSSSRQQRYGARNGMSSVWGRYFERLQDLRLAVFGYSGIQLFAWAGGGENNPLVIIIFKYYYYKKFFPLYFPICFTEYLNTLNTPAYKYPQMGVRNVPSSGDCETYFMLFTSVLMYSARFFSHSRRAFTFVLKSLVFVQMREFSMAEGSRILAYSST